MDKTHFVYAGWYYESFDVDRLRSIILREMKNYKLKSVMVTMMFIRKYNLITKEEMANYCKGKRYEENSVNDDLESLFDDLRLKKEPFERVETYFLPKLTAEELKLVERKDSSYLKTFARSNFDVKEAEMRLSESNSKFVRARCSRRTFTIKNSS